LSNYMLSGAYQQRKCVLSDLPLTEPQIELETRKAGLGLGYSTGSEHKILAKSCIPILMYHLLDDQRLRGRKRERKGVIQRERERERER